jgi:pyridoxamine 5'-phosphate oxidase
MRLRLTAFEPGYIKQKYDCMTTAPWRSPLARNLHKHRSEPQARFLQLATIAANGYPANRTVVFRGFLDGSIGTHPAGNQLKFVTDARSQKVSQIEQNSKCEACWYFPKTREQFRITGNLISINYACLDLEMQAARYTAWQELSDPARLQFAWPEPGQLRADDPQYFYSHQPHEMLPLDNFCLLLLEPVQVDRLELRGSPQNRWLFTLDAAQAWMVQAINP